MMNPIIRLYVTDVIQLRVRERGMRVVGDNKEKGCDLCKGDVISEELPSEKHPICGAMWITTKKAILFCNDCSKKIRMAKEFLDKVKRLNEMNRGGR